MKRVITYLLVILSGTLLVGCPQAENRVRSFIRGYYEIDDIYIQIGHNNNLIEIGGAKNSENWTYYSESIQKEKYDVLCRKHNDMSWNGAYNTYYALGVDFLSIDFVSDADFDETHSAGTSLADILEFESESYYPYLKNGYNRGQSNRINPPTRIIKPLSELTIDDMVMLGQSVPNLVMYPSYELVIAYLDWLSEPTLSKTHNITVTMISDDGRTFEKTIEVSWE